MKIIKNLPGASSSRVDLVVIDGKMWVLKTAEVVEIENEKAFYQALESKGIPTLAFLEEGLPNNQMLLEYVPGSPTLGTVFDGVRARRWGERVKVLHEITSDNAAILDCGLKVVAWGEFISQEIAEAVHRQEIKNGLSPDEVTVFLERVTSLKKHIPKNYSLIHADLHPNNVLLKDGELILFDKGSGIFYGDPWYDLATIALEFPIETIITPTEDSFWGEFCNGYGNNPAVHPNFLSYMLLRVVGRYPNRFLPKSKEIITCLLSL